MKQLLRQFYFTKAERYGVSALLVLIVLLWIAPDIYRLGHKQGQSDFSTFSEQIKTYTKQNEPVETEQNPRQLFVFDPNSASVEIFVQLGLSERVAKTIVKYRERGGQFRTADDLQRIYSLPEEDFERLRPYVRIGASTADGYQKVFAHAQETPAPAFFPFDPNTAPEVELLRLGLPRPLVARLLRYREKGGFFFDKQDFRKLYGLQEQDFLRLEPYIDIKKSNLAVHPVSYAGGGFAQPETAIDINTAAAEIWQRLPGIGATRAYKIVQFRDKLGGFTHVSQVAETKGLPDSIFQLIRNRLLLETPVYRKIDLNTATPAVLAVHPYFTTKQAELIVAYRQQHGPYRSVDDIERIAAFSDRQWLEQAKGYLKVE